MWRIGAFLKWRFAKVTRIKYLVLSIKQGIYTQNCIFALETKARKVNRFKKHLDNILHRQRES